MYNISEYSYTIAKGDIIEHRFEYCLRDESQKHVFQKGLAAGRHKNTGLVLLQIS